MDINIFPDCPTKEELQRLKDLYPREKWIYSGAEVEDNGYINYMFRPIPTCLPKHIDAINLLVDREQEGRAHGRVLQDWDIRFPHVSHRIPQGDPFLMMDHDALDFWPTDTDTDDMESDDMESDDMVSDDMEVEEEAEESDIFSSGDDTHSFPSVDNDSGNES